MGWFSTAALLGRFSAPALGGVILAVYASGNSLGYNALYIVCGFTGLLALLAMFLLPDHPHNRSEKKPRKAAIHWRQGVKQLLSNRAIMITCAVEAAILFAYGIFETFLPLRGVIIGLSAWEIGLCISSQILTIAISKPVLGRFSDRHGRPSQIICGTFLAGICMLVLAFSFSFLSLIAVSILLGLSISVVTSASAAHIADLSKKGSHGSAMGMLGSIMDIGHTTGPMVGGALAVSFGLTVSFLSGCVVLMLSGFTFMICSK